MVKVLLNKMVITQLEQIRAQGSRRTFQSDHKVQGGPYGWECFSISFNFLSLRLSFILIYLNPAGAKLYSHVHRWCGFFIFNKFTSPLELEKLWTVCCCCYCCWFHWWGVVGHQIVATTTSCCCCCCCRCRYQKICLDIRSKCLDFFGLF